MPYCNLLLALLLSWLTTLTFAADDSEFLPVNEAFKVSAEEAGNHVHFTFTIADGYYLYKHRFGFEPTAGTPGLLGEPVYQQAGKWKDDPIFGQVEVFYSKVDVYVPVEEAEDGFIEVDARYQGCADKGLCYIPQTYTNMYQIDVNAPAPDINPETPHPRPESSQSTDMAPSEGVPEPLDGSKESLFSEKKPESGLTASKSTDLDADDALSLENFLSENGLFSILGVFFLIGIGLTFTPCVLPMVPILSGIIVGQGTDLSRSKAAALSITYVLGMAVTYAGLGVVAGLTGAKLQVAMQNPTVLFSFAAVFVVLSFSMFGFYELQLPSSVQNKLNNISQKQQGGTYIGVAIIGILSALVVSPCVSAPLAGALLYIGQSGDWLMGGLALLALGLGMGAPLIAIGVTGANILPKAGGWMDNVKGLFGVMLLAVALWLVKHLLPEILSWVIAGGLFILAGLYLGALDPLTSPKGKLFRGIGLSLLACGAALIIAQFISSPSQTVSGNSVTQVSGLPFQRIRSEQSLEQALATAQSKGQPVMIDYFADWCTACFEMEHETFSQGDVQARLGSHMWLQIDLTNNPEDSALLQRYNLPGPPAILFFNSRGEEVKTARIYAYKSKSQFLSHLDQHQIQ
ncbi:MAG: thiol:disulfide interchange protein [Pseudomonadales bacterium]|nr:thiol:disulfide interchange protein [Pseudomonadales bacterium]